MLQGLVNNAIGKNLRSVGFDNHRLSKIKDATLSPGHVMEIPEAIWNNKDFIGASETIVK